MTTILPPPPPTPPPSGGGSNAATLVTPSSEVAALARGATIEGVVAAIVAKNQIQVQTVLGTLALQTATRVPVNSVISLVVSQLQPQQVLQITSLNGVPLAGSVASGAAGILGAGTGGSATGGAPGAGGAGTTLPIMPGTQASATLLRPANGILQPSSQTSSTQTPAPTTAQTPVQTAGNSPRNIPVTPGTTPAGMQAPGQPSGQASGAKPAGQPAGVITPQTPGSLSNASTQASSGGTPSSPTAQTTPATGPSQPAGAAGTRPQAGINAKTINTVIPSGTRFNANVIKVDAPTSAPANQSATPSPAINTGQNTNAVLTMARGTIMTGTVTGLTSSGQPILQLPSAIIALDVQGRVIVGSKITIEITGDAQAPKQTTAASALIQAGGRETFVKSNSWNSLNEALKAIEISDPGRFNQIIQNVMPQVGSKLSSQILFFISALRSGDIKNWLGETPVRLIERERPGLLGRIGNEFQTMGKLADDPSNGDWRMAMIPLYHNERVDRIRLYQRNARNKNKDNDDGKRFVLDFDLSKLGHMQIDGLVKSDDSRVDVIIRTEKSLGRKAQMEIAQIYNDAAELTGIGGGIAFQSSPGNFVEFPSMTENTDHDGLIV